MKLLMGLMTLSLVVVSQNLSAASKTRYKLVSSNSGMVKHAVFFRYKEKYAKNQRALKEIRKRFLELKHTSLKKGKPYIVSIDAGVANSHEGADLGLKDGYILTFKSIVDRDYYVGCNQRYKCSDGGFKAAGKPYDKAHDKFKSFVGPLLYDGDGDGSPVPEGVFVFDFTAQ